jgi:lipid II:glycine glycyltransferase (peptidoglycan interpeptide bridge formation enzyme)
MSELTPSQWDQFLQVYPEAHLLQTSAWGELKSSFGWHVYRVRSKTAAAQVLIRPLRFGYSLAYVPKGPLGQDWPSLWEELDALCRKEHCVFLKIEPDLWEPLEPGFVESCLPGFNPSHHTIQPPRTVLVDISGSENDILARMKQKTRYNLRLAEKKGVIVKPSSDLGAFYTLMQATGQRDGFPVHSLEYYQKVFSLLSPSGACQLLLAYYENTPLAGLMVFRQGERAWYFYGASNDLERQRMPAYLLQWEAMRWARQSGCRWYDLWGIPDASEPELEANFETRSDGLWGVYRFKRGFGGEVRRSPGAWDKVYHPVLYKAYLNYARHRAGLEPG